MTYDFSAYLWREKWDNRIPRYKKHRFAHDPVECFEQHWPAVLKVYREDTIAVHALTLGSSRETCASWVLGRFNAYDHATRLRRCLEEAERRGLVTRARTDWGYTIWRLV